MFLIPIKKIEIQLQTMCDLTCTRLAKVQAEKLKTFPKNRPRNLTLVSKWGCAVSSGHPIYDPRLNESIFDGDMCMVSFVPLELISSDGQVIVWQNPRTSSTRFCRPILLQYSPDIDELNQSVITSIEAQIQSLIPTAVNSGNKKFNVTHKLIATDVDGKICNANTETGLEQRCYLCSSTLESFNNIDEMLQKQVAEGHLNFAISKAHVWIRMFECLLHISYKLTVMKFNCDTAADSKVVNERMKAIVEKFEADKDFRVQNSNPDYGSSHDASRARRFFKDASSSSAITGIDEELIKCFHTILQVISCGHAIHIEAFKSYCLDTARRFVDLYPWYYMPITVHKILIHSHVIKQYILPIGQMAWKAHEDRNWHIENCEDCGDCHCYCTRDKILSKIFDHLLVSSDPVVSSALELPKKEFKKLPPAVTSMLIAPEVGNERSDSDSSDGDDSSSEDENYYYY